jgi:hypothetical protein
MGNRPDLIVPIRDRRQRRRILTLKNFGKVALGMIIFFAGLTMQSNYRKTDTNGDYGRLLGKQVSSHVAIEPRIPDIVTVPIQDQTAADPLLVAPAAREQWLGVNGSPATTAAIAPQTDSSAVAGPGGIVIVRSKIDQRHPTLSGGIFRQ